jgi:hypothetical protein
MCKEQKMFESVSFVCTDTKETKMEEEIEAEVNCKKGAL